MKHLVTFLLLLGLFLLLVGCQQLFTEPLHRPSPSTAPVSPQPTKTISCDHVVVSVEGMTLNGWLRYEAPRRMRLVLFSHFGRELELGSNNAEFWFWCRRMDWPALYYAQHGQRTRLKAPFNPEFVLRSLEHNTDVTDASGKLLCRSRIHGNVIEYQWIEENHSMRIELKDVSYSAKIAETWSLPDDEPRVDMARM
jgi:hypothetical protein